MNRPLYLDINLYIIFAITLGGVVSVSLIIPVLPVISEHFSLKQGEIGFLISLYTLPGLFFIVFIGALSDKVGRKPVLIVSLTLFSIAGGLIYWVDDYFWMLVLRFIQGVGGATLPAISIILIGDLFPDDMRLKIIGFNAAVLSVGTAAFPLLGGLLAMDGWSTPFLAFWLGLPLALFIALKLKEPVNSKGAGEGSLSNYFKGAREYIFSVKSFFAFSIGLLVFILLYGGILTYLVLYMDHRFNMSPFMIGAYIAVASIGSGFIAPLSSRLEKIIGGRAMLVSGFIAFAISFFLITIATSEVLLLAVLLLVGIGMGITLPLVQSIVVGIAPIEYRGVMVSSFAMTIRAGQTVGPPLLAIFLVNGEIVDIFKVCLVISTSFALLLFVWGEIFTENKNTQMTEPKFEV